MNHDPHSSDPGTLHSSRRDFLQWTGKLAAGSAVAAMAIPWVHAAEDTSIRLALIGCGRRGTEAAVDAFRASGGLFKLYAMADLFESRLQTSHRELRSRFPGQVDVTDDRQFTGFDSYKQAIDSLRPGDVAMLCGYAGWRPMHLEYAVWKGVNVFMEKCFATDPPGVRRVIEAGERAETMNLKIAAGLMCRHSASRQELVQRIREGALGEIQSVRAYCMEPVEALKFKPVEQTELNWQIRNFVHFYWVSGGLWADMDIHQIDEICWLKDAWPTAAHGIGGRAINSTDCGQNLDSYSVEWTFPDGTQAYNVVRYLPNCHNDFGTFVLGTKCAAQFSGKRHAATVHTYKDRRCRPDNIDWQAAPEERSPWQAEWFALLDAIVNDRPHNEAKRAAMSNLAAIMGRAAVHAGQLVTWDEAMASNFQWCDNIDDLNERSSPPVEPDVQGRYPSPVAGLWKEL